MIGSKITGVDSSQGSSNGGITMNEAIETLIKNADAIVIGAGAGLSASAGITYSGERFNKHFAQYIKRYGISDMYSAGFYPFDTEEEKWAYWSKHIYHNRYAEGAKELYVKLYDLMKDQEHFVLTTNVDHQFYLAGFSEDRIFATQGDYGLIQCSKPCHDTLYDNEVMVTQMLLEQKDCKIPSSLVPKCPVCGASMSMHLRADDTFVQNKDWDKAHHNYQQFIERYKDKKLLLIELGVGMNTPSIIKYPFWRLTHQLGDAFYLCINRDEAWSPEEIKHKSLCVEADIMEVLTA